MKKLFLLLSLITLIACQKNEQFTVLSGTIEDSDSTKISIEGINYDKEISMQKGSFSDTLNLPYDGLYNFIVNDQDMFFIYLEKGFQLNLKTIQDDFHNKMNFTGKGSSENNFLVQKVVIAEKVYGSVSSREEAMKTYSVDEKAFLAKGELYKKEINQKIKESKIDNAKFLSNEKKDIAYYILKMNDNFPRYHAFFTKILNLNQVLISPN